MRCRVLTECNGTRAESRFGLLEKRTSPFMLLVVFMLDSDYSPSSVITNNINGLVRFAGRPNLLSAFYVTTGCLGLCCPVSAGVLLHVLLTLSLLMSYIQGDS